MCLPDGVPTFPDRENLVAAHSQAGHFGHELVALGNEATGHTASFEERVLLISVAFLVCAVLWPGVCDAQSLASGTIAGTVRDTTGAVLPGVTVEATSPALIEKVRTVVTDGQGQYKIVDLRPGTYSVSFTLGGFTAFRREGIELTTAFTATVNADLRVEALEETITVTGASPVIDTQNVRQQNVLSREHLDALPTAKNMQAFAALTLGANLSPGSQDVGGNKGENPAHFGIHGSDGFDSKLKLDGMGFNNNTGQGGGMMRNYKINQGAAQEVVLETGGMSAESETGGVQINVVPKEGGNTFKGYANADFTNGRMQADNLSAEHRARGLIEAAEIKDVYDVGAGVGGPIRRDRLWFYGSFRRWSTTEYQPFTYFNRTQDTLFYAPDFSRRGFRRYYSTDYTARFTWQAAARHKLNFLHSQQFNCHCATAASAVVAPEAANFGFLRPTVTQATWSFPAGGRLLFEAGATLGTNPQDLVPLPGVTRDDISVLELSNNLRYGSRVATGTGRVTAYKYNDLPNYSNQANQRFSVQYVTGSHAFKAGLFLQEGWAVNNTTINHALSYTFRNQQPVSVTQYAVPFQDEQRLMPSLGLYAQDQWTLRRLTLNLGLRFDYLNAYDPEFHYEGGPFVPAYDFPALHDVPNWKDLSPRMGAAYDLFGNGKTAVKGYLSRFVAGQAVGIAALLHPSQAIVTSADRIWSDANGDFVPDCDLRNPASNGECGALSNANFGKPVVSSGISPDLLRGFGVRNYNWQGSLAIQHELHRGVAVNLAYFRTWYGNIQVVDNTRVTPADFDTYCLSAPVDARLPGGGGYQVCGLYDVKPEKFGQVFSETTLGSRFGELSQIYNGIDLSLNARFGRGGLLSGGANVGRTMLDNCAVVDVQPQFCRNGPPYQSQFKVNGSYPLPWQLHVSGVFQSLPGVPIDASVVATNAQVAAALGRPLAACSGRVPCTATATLVALEPNTMFEDRLNQLDLRLTRSLTIGRAQVRAMFDIYNVFNAGTVLGSNSRYGTAWLTPTAILGGRTLKFGGHFEF
jgi:hypothetical protein